MTTFTPGQEIIFRNSGRTSERRYYVGTLDIAGEIRYVIRKDSGIIEHCGHIDAFTAVTSRLPLTTTLYYCARVRCKS